MIDIGSYVEEVERLGQGEQDSLLKLYSLGKILNRLAREMTADVRMQFPNLFARLVYIAQHYEMPSRLEWKLQHLRVQAKEYKKIAANFTNNKYKSHESALLDFIQFAESRIYKGDSEEDIYHEYFNRDPKDILFANQKEHLRVQIIEIDHERELIYCRIEKEPDAKVSVRYNVLGVNDRFNISVEHLWEGAQLNLVDYSTNADGELLPKMIVLEPDYLIDASAVANCFHDFCTTEMHYFRSKFESVENRDYILLGNLANYFLDELVYAEDIESVKFNETFLESFKQMPFEYTSCEDLQDRDDFVSYMENAHRQFTNIKRVVSNDFPKLGIDVGKSTLEPAFFSERYGFQGRLDMFYHGSNRFKIIELKSGKLPYPYSDPSKIADSHEVQTAVYRFLIESVFGVDPHKVEAAILYSAGDKPGVNVRFAAVYQELMHNIINMRNIIVVNEHRLVNGNNETVEQLLGELFATADSASPRATFYPKQLDAIKKVFLQCSDLERSYFYRFVRFISRELYLQKIGDIDYETPAGVAALWNSDFSERAEALEVLYDLTIEEIDNSGRDMVIIFRRNNVDNEIVNFREGEICIVYPRNEESDTVLNKQVLKGSIANIDKNYVKIRFRQKQRNHTYFDDNIHWAVEHDTLDSSYNMMYKGLYDFLHAAKQKRELLMGIREPKAVTIDGENLKYPETIIEKAVAAEDYFLIVGPPGTGKTSILARRLIEEYHSRPDVNILVLAYTNRAVDELCDTINAAMGCEDRDSDAYIRIGSELSCEEKFRGRLLQNVSTQATSREELHEEIERTRIFVATLASINGKQELFKLKKFDVAIIDEASQILEPQIVGLLPNFSKFIMIGDHNQLPAIVLQKGWIAAVEEPELRDIGIRSCAYSLFERLLHQAMEQGWEHSYAQLTHQGRMHNDIALFPSEEYYTEKLLPVSEWQSEHWNMKPVNSDNVLEQMAASQRIGFISTERFKHIGVSNKINKNEAKLVVDLIAALKHVYETNGVDLRMGSIGVITPYRNQIALIRHKLSVSGMDDTDSVMIDTVERFQGSQRDIIIVSFCVNQPYQLNFLCNMNDKGTVDRKLNVTLTRARQQMFLIGNATVLKRHPIYATLLEHYKDKTVVL